MEIVVFGGFAIAAIIVAASVFEVIANRPPRGRGKQPPCPPPPPKAVDRPPRGSRLKGMLPEHWPLHERESSYHLHPRDFPSFDPIKESAMHPSTENLLRFFEYEHLPAPQREISKHFHKLAHDLASGMPTANLGFELDGPELTVALRKLLEAKDCAVRASLPQA